MVAEVEVDGRISDHLGGRRRGGGVAVLGEVLQRRAEPSSTAA
jgi:hypothetical protein